MPRRTRSIDANWTRVGVEQILIQSPMGRATLRELYGRRRLVRVLCSEMYDEYQYRADENSAWPPSWERRNIWGEVSRTGPQEKQVEIRLHPIVRDFYAAWTLVHEMVHVRQGPRPQAEGLEDIDVGYRRELEAHLAEIEFLTQNPGLISRENLGDDYDYAQRALLPTEDGYRVNVEEVAARVKRVYVDPFVHPEESGTLGNPLYREKPQRTYRSTRRITGWRPPRVIVARGE